MSFEPHLKIGENEFVPLHKCTREQTASLMDQLIKNYYAIRKLKMSPSIINQSLRMYEMAERRMQEFIDGHIKDENAPKKKIKKRIRILGDD